MSIWTSFLTECGEKIWLQVDGARKGRVVGVGRSTNLIKASCTIGSGVVRRQRRYRRTLLQCIHGERRCGGWVKYVRTGCGHGVVVIVLVVNPAEM